MRDQTIADLPQEALQMAFFQIGASSSFPRGWVHEKTVPYSIIGQACAGEYAVTCSGRTIRVRAPEAFLAPAYQPLRIVHHHDAKKGFVARWIHFSFVLYQTIDLASLLDMPLRIEARAGRQLGRIIEELSGPSPDEHQPQLDRLVGARESMWSVLRIVCAMSKLKPGAVDHLKVGRRLARLLGHLKNNLSEHITVRQMADLTHMSPSAFFAFFKNRMDCSPMEYLKHLRLNEAATQFSTTDRLLKEVAHGTGFANPFHLSREFKRRFGLSPRHYRQLDPPSRLLLGRSPAP